MKDDQFTQLLRAINNVGDDLRDFKNEMNRRWDENDKRWEKNEKRWEENERRWQENDKKWVENRKELDKLNEKIDKINERLNKMDEKVERYHKETRTIFDEYEKSIENMYQDNRKKITILEKRATA